MKKRNIVKSKILFNEIIQKGKRNSNKYFVICTLPKKESNNSFGLAVGKKIGNAVTRNKLKRQLRYIIDKNITLFPNYLNYIIICKKDILKLKFQKIELELINLVKEINYEE